MQHSGGSATLDPPYKAITPSRVEQAKRFHQYPASEYRSAQPNTSTGNVLLEPAVGLCNPLAKGDFRSPAHGPQTAHIQKLARRAVGLSGKGGAG